MLASERKLSQVSEYREVIASLNDSSFQLQKYLGEITHLGGSSRNSVLEDKTDSL